jgi:hypothetical protein
MYLYFTLNAKPMKTQILLLLFVLLFTPTQGQKNEHNSLFVGIWYPGSCKMIQLTDSRTQLTAEYIGKELQKICLFGSYIFNENGLFKEVNNNYTSPSLQEGIVWETAVDTIRLTYATDSGRLTRNYTFRLEKDSTLFLKYTDPLKIFFVDIRLNRWPCQ